MINRRCLIAALAGAVALLAQGAWATVPRSSQPEVSSAALSPEGSELRLAFLDREAVTPACDYHVARMEYVAASQLLLVELGGAEPCQNDRVARRAGRLAWTLPSALRGAGRLSLVLGGRLAGELVFSGSEVSFVSVR